MDNRDAYTALVGDLSSAEPQLRMLGGLPKWFLLAASRVKDEKRGPKSGHVYWLVGDLDDQHSSREKKFLARIKTPIQSDTLLTFAKLLIPALNAAQSTEL